MEKSSNSMNKSPPYKHNIISSNNNNDQISPDDQESGWTMYLEDFFLQNNNEQSFTINSFNTSSCESSLISDACSAAKKLADNNNNNGEQVEDVRFAMKFNRRCCNNRFSFKKRKTIIEANNLVDDDALEDTASSPLNSPKVFNLSQVGVKPKEKEDDQNNMFEEDKGISNSGKSNDQSSHEKLDTGKEKDCTELKKRGLCLVPLSVLVNNIG